MPRDEYPPDEAYEADLSARLSRLEVPHNSEAEQGLLGALLIDNRQFERIADLVSAEDFYTPVHGRIFSAIATVIGRGAVASPVTLKQHFKHDGDLDAVQGGAYLADLAANTASALACRDYAEHIADLALRRGIYTMAETLKRDASIVDVETSAITLIETAEAELYRLAEARQEESAERAFSSVIADVIDAAAAAYRGDGKIMGLSTGLVDLDRKTGGLMPTDLYILAGRPSMGKTALATNIAFEAARRRLATTSSAGAVVAFYSMEMSAKQIGHRIVCQRAGVDNMKARDGQLSNDEFSKMMRAGQELAAAPFFIDDTPALRVSQLRARARRIKRKHGLGLIVIDYVQLMRGSGKRQSADNRAAEISEISRDLKALAKELGVPILALSQVGRTVEQRDDKRPQLSDLRESGSLEQDADTVMFVFREEYYLQREEPKRLAQEKQENFTDRMNAWQEAKIKAANVAEVIIGKQRAGPVGTLKLHFDGPTTEFSDLHAHYSLGE